MVELVRNPLVSYTVPSHACLEVLPLGRAIPSNNYVNLSTRQCLHKRPPRAVSSLIQSYHSLPRATTWGASVLNRLKRLGPTQLHPKFRIWQDYSQHTPSPRGGCLAQLRPVLTNCNVSFHVTANLSPTVRLSTNS
jgi:hypothetical protein